jgi:outer membrane protein TolC
VKGTILVLALCSAAHSQPVPVASLYAAALAHAPVLGEAAADARRADFEKERAAAGFLPRVSASGESDGWASAAQANPQIIVRPGHEDSWELRAEETVFEGGRVVNRYRQASGEARSAGYSQAARRQALLHEVGTLSLRWLEASESVRQADAELERRAGHLDDMKKRQFAGSVPESDTLRAESELDKAKSEKIESARLLLETRSRLETLTGLDLSAGLAAPGPLPLPGQSREDLAKTASEKNPRISADRESLSAAQAGKKAQEGGFLPSVVVGGAYRGMRESPQAFDYLSHETLGFVQARWALFSGGQTRASVKAAQAAAEGSAERLRQTKDARSLDARLAFDAAKADESAIAAETSRRDSAAAAYDKVKKRYEAGMDPYLNLLDAATALKTADAALNRARYARERSVLDLYLALGALDEAVAAR